MLFLRKDKFLWYVLAIIGINISKFQLGILHRCLSIFIQCVLYLLMINWFSAGIVCCVTNSVMAGFFHTSLSGITGLMWYFLKKKKNVLAKIIMQLNEYRNRYDTAVNKDSCFITIGTIILILLPSIASLVVYFTIEFDAPVIPFFTYGYKLSNNILKSFFMFYSIIMYSTCCNIFFLITVSLSLIFYKFTKLLKSFNKSLQLSFVTIKYNGNIELFTDFFAVLKLLQKLNHILAYPSFLIVVYGLQIIFTSFFLVLSMREKLALHSLISLQLAFNFVCGTFLITMYTICCSMVPDVLNDIKDSAQDILNKYGINYFLSEDDSFYLKEIEKEDVLHISACGMFLFTRSFILSAIGFTLTYAMLIIYYKDSFAFTGNN